MALARAVAVALVAMLLAVCSGVSPASASNLLGCSFENAEGLLRQGRRGGVRLLDHDGDLLAALGKYYAPPVPFAKLPAHLSEALIAKEDRRFREHNGIDVQGIGRAVSVNLQRLTISQGGSTLTQQVLKNTCFQDDPGAVRKLKELATATALESAVSKDEILYVYLNVVDFGRRAHGVQAAARLYFDKYAQRLTLKESALLVQLLSRPSLANPHADSSSATAGADRLLDLMVAQGRVTKAAAARAKKEQPKIAASQGAVPGFYAGGRLDLGWFATWARREAEARLGAVSGIPEVRTTLWPELQSIAARRLGRALRIDGAKLGFDQGAILVMSPVGEVLAMVGGRDFRGSEWNNVTQAKRQPGSAFKLFVYLAALERGVSPVATIDDSPLLLPSGRIRNHDGRHRGTITLADAFAVSSNTAAIRLSLGHVPEIRTIARRLGVTAPLTPEVGLALGVSEVTLLEMVTANAALANAGRKVAPRAIVEIRDGFDRVVWCDGHSVGEQVIERQRVQQMRGLLAAVVGHGTGRAADPGFPAWGKTGTTDDSRDAWFIGFTDRFVAGVWIGNQQPTAMRGVTGGGVPARIWREVMRDAHKLRPYRRMPCTAPSG